MIKRNLIWVLTIIFYSFVVISCSDYQPTAPPVNNSGAPLAKFSDLQVKVFNNCLGAQCHSSAGNQGNLTLEAGISFNNLVGVQSSLFPQYKRVEAGNSSNSLIIKILRGEVSPRMPLNGSPLPSATIDSIAKWIDQGALNN
ncbi:MAG: hypothetical protein LDL01_00040 [Ignavibacterium sp.]|jgi:hypothetical protein|uniref:Cytochrome C Planctomycete-type domain-containing protein n=1 Tax=Ignavibacterium album TaxID=591197 RepID=A0A7V2ZM51_9BACT|nr:hypothetical protein [Ignavibacterium album]MCA2004156.1 hypothetical protein [Ignavibacterium sp.]MCX8104425.1 hypothetical protein [Ignavibacterium album]